MISISHQQIKIEIFLKNCVKYVLDENAYFYIEISNHFIMLKYYYTKFYKINWWVVIEDLILQGPLHHEDCANSDIILKLKVVVKLRETKKFIFKMGAQWVKILNICFNFLIKIYYIIETHRNQITQKKFEYKEIILNIWIWKCYEEHRLKNIKKTRI